MLHCTMVAPIDIQLALEDLLAELHFARRNDQLGRLALLAYCDTKAWARRAGKPDLADTALKMFSETPSVSKEAFLQGIDDLIAMLELHEREYRRTTVHCTPHSPQLRPNIGRH